MPVHGGWLPGNLVLRKEGRRQKKRHLSLSKKDYIQLASLDSKFDSKFLEFMTIVKCENSHEKMLQQQTEQWLVLTPSSSGTTVNSQLLRNSGYHSEVQPWLFHSCAQSAGLTTTTTTTQAQSPFNCSHCFQIDLWNFFPYQALWIISQRASEVSVHPFRYHLTFFLSFEFDSKKLTGS